MRLLPRLVAAAGVSTVVLTALAGPALTSPAMAGEHVVGGDRLAGRGLVADLGAGVPAPPTVASAAYVIADADTGAVLAAKAPHARYAPASTLKALTALTLHPKADAATVYRATWHDAHVEGSKAGIVPGGTYTVQQLWQAVFLRSGNDAVNCLASLNGGVTPTLGEMRAKAAELGARDTTIANATGLDAPGQLTSAYDLALIGRAVTRVPELMEYASTIRAPFPGKVVPAGKPRPSFQLWTQQRFVLGYDGARGIKNGFTTHARYTLIAASTRGDRTVLVTILRSPRNAWKDAAALSDWAFRYGGRAGPVGTLVEPGSPEATGAAAAAPPPAAPPADRVVAASTLPVDTSSTAAAIGWVVVALAAAVVALRARVLLRQRSRARR